MVGIWTIIVLQCQTQGGDNMSQNEVKSAIAEVVAILEPLSNEDKKQALALLQGMVIGKELAKEQKTA